MSTDRGSNKPSVQQIYEQYPNLTPKSNEIYGNDANVYITNACFKKNIITDELDNKTPNGDTKTQEKLEYSENVIQTTDNNHYDDNKWPTRLETDESNRKISNSDNLVKEMVDNPKNEESLIQGTGVENQLRVSNHDAK